MRISGTTVSWNAVSGVSGFVFVKKVPGQADVYSVVNGTSTTPAAVAGTTVTYSVRTAVDGSAWAPEQSITYPAGASTPVAAPVATAPASPTGFAPGVVSSSDPLGDLSKMQLLGAKHVRVEFAIGTAPSAMAATVDSYARAGVQLLLLAGFAGRVPTDTEARNLGTWAAAFGPGGSFWAGKGYAASTAVTQIEFGNESSYAYQYPQISGDSNWANTTFYKGIAQGYALRAKDASIAIKAANPNVGMLAIDDVPGNWPTWMDAAFAAVPNLGDYVAGWTVHPYGPNWGTHIDDSISQARAHGAPDSIPVVATEFGFSSDNGRCLSDNYGWNSCMSYDSAGSSLTSSLSSMRSKYGSRLGGVYLYQVHDLANAGATNDREAYFGLLKIDGSSKGSLTTAAQSYLAG